MGELARRRAASMTGVLALVAAPSCVFFVPDEAGLQTSACHFASQSSACGACIADHCMHEVDACCVDGGCRGHLAALDSCAKTAATSACTALATSSSTGLAALGRCVASSCSACFVGTVPSSSSGITCASVDATLCTCTTSTDPTIVGTDVPTCDETMGLTCCAQPGWPGGEDGLSQCVCTNEACFSQNVEVPSCGP